MEVTLGVAQDVAGLSLPAGTVVMFREDGSLLACVILVPHTTEGRAFAAGTRISFEHGAWQLDRAETGY